VATVYWYEPLVPETGQCDICFSMDVPAEENCNLLDDLKSTVSTVHYLET